MSRFDIPCSLAPTYTTQASCEAAGNVWSSSTGCAATGTHNNATIILGQNTTNLCFGCHQSLAKTANGTGADTDLNLTGKIPVANNVTAPAYVPKYSGHVIGDQFLNSPHARFTGTITPNKLGRYDLTTNDKSQYTSTFNGMDLQIW